MELDGVWNVERAGGALPPLPGVRKRIHGTRGETLLGPVRAEFVVAGDELRYRPPFVGVVDRLRPEGDGFVGTTTIFGREVGHFRMTREGSPMATIDEQLVKHLDEAYAMEQNVLRMLEVMITTTDDPDIVRELEHHKIQTEGHAELMKARLAAHGAGPSFVKEFGGVLGALMKVPLDVVRGEKVARNARDAYATEHMEIAAYELLLRVAERAGDEATMIAASAILEEEREMAVTIEANWDRFVELSLSEAGVTA